jgi:hypothetical protein
MASRKHSDIDLEMDTEEILTRWGWWNVLNALAKIALDKKRTAFPLSDRHWTFFSMALDHCARVYGQFCDDGSKKDAGKPRLYGKRI